MIEEREIIQAIKDQIKTDIPKYGVNTEPPDLDKYHCRKPKGEILIKPIRGIKEYTAAKMSPVLKDDNHLTTFTFRLILVDKSFKNYDRLFNLSFDVEKAMKAINFGNGSTFYLTDFDDPAFNKEKGFVFRSQLYIIITQNLI